jgi:hypothetical protein
MMFAWTEQRRGRRWGGRGPGSLYLIATHAGYWDKFQTKIELACCVALSKAQAGNVANPTRVSGQPHHNRSSLSDQQGSAGHGIGRSGSAMAGESLSRDRLLFPQPAWCCLIRRLPKVSSGSYFWRCSEKCLAGELEDPEPLRSLRLWYKSPIAWHDSDCEHLPHSGSLLGSRMLVLTARALFRVLAILS